MTSNYYNSGQYDYDSRRTVAWKEIIKFLTPFIKSEAVVVDLGAGYCDFINQVQAAKKYAVDYSPEISKFTGPGVQAIQAPAWDLSMIQDNSVDVVHASNLFEHFDDIQLGKVVSEVNRVLKRGGKIILLQPNFRLQPGRYFDDHTHKKVFNDSSLASFLISNGYKIVLNMPRFLPQEVKDGPSILPNFLLPFIVRIYIHSPLKPLAGQMLLIGEKL